jgi:hypothetical protein
VNLSIRILLLQYDECSNFFFFCSRSRVTRVSLGTDFGGRVDSGQIIDFLDAGGNLIVAADYGLGDAVRLIGRECGRRFNLLMRSSVLLIILFHVTCAGVFFDTSDTKVLDHLNYDARDVDGDHSVIIADNFNKAATVVRFFFFCFWFVLSNSFRVLQVGVVVRSREVFLTVLDIRS